MSNAHLIATGLKLLTAMLAVFLFAAPAAAHPDFKGLFQQSYARRTAYFDTVIRPYLQQLPESEQERMLKDLKRRARKERDYPAELEIVVAEIRFQDRMGHLNTSEKIRALKQVLHGLEGSGHKEYEAVIMAFLAQNYYGKKHNYGLAFEYFLNAYEISRKFSQRDFPDKKRLMVELGNRYYTIGAFERARELLLEADTLHNPRESHLDYNGKNTLGLIDRERAHFDRAMAYFIEARNAARADGNAVWAAIANGNIGITYYRQGAFQKAIPLLKEDIEHCLKPFSGAAENGVNSLLILADIYLKQGRLDQVRQAIQEVRSNLHRCRDKMRPLSKLYPLIAQYLYHSGDYKAAFGYQDSAARYKDSLHARDNVFMLAKVEHKKDMEKAATEMKRLDAERRLLSLTRNGLIIGILFLFVLAGFILNRQRLKYRIRQMEILSKKVEAENDLRRATKQLEDYTRHLQEKNQVIEAAGKKMEYMQAELQANVPKVQMDSALQQLYGATILTEEEWMDFKQLFDQVHQGFIQRLKEKMPELTPADTRFLVLSKLNLTNKEMAGILGVQPDTIRSYKHRLRRRFDLPQDADMKAFVDAI